MRLGHVGLTATDPEGLADFYTSFLGLTRVAEAVTEQTGRLILLSSRPGEAPDLQLLANPAARHVAFRVDTLAELRERYAAAVRRGVRVLFSFDHGATLSFYVLDPAGNACELYWETGATGRRGPATNRPIDLTQPEEALRALIAAGGTPAGGSTPPAA
jgi:catechol-2,3-dioxygenase